ncbi:iron chelate uptake ABC transporter family permease subunit [Psychromarinibacter sp. C21-152]|uniref:Iron chelate uptake ABC transporter family permease subunit n=1 Tax=Psychromarinibacter sediminicola TaxID=3033385 RepID=A0AAE3NXP0_9RHOB|nr:iron chelate uptake ABC transporter family permease subunit [Psychromarinibacter sediminicola]MDF0602552.1 iron chelate uptake ABC transporter family permease subunit [Psychromarinibacter sediminicola]
MADRRLLALGGLLALVTALFLLWGVRAPYGFILSLRAEKLFALILVGAATGAATVIFQTVAANRLLTPGIVGFDALFVFIQTGLVMALGGIGFSALPAMPKFLAEAACLTAAAMALFGTLFRKGAEDIIRMILTGVILGVLLRGLAGFAQRLLEPSEFAVVQQASIASFNTVDDGQAGIAAAVLTLALLAAWRMAPALDAAALGRTKARTLGLDHNRLVLAALGIVALLVSVSTALVGPVTFLGLLAASLAHAALRAHRHAVLIPAAALIGAAILVAGQTVFERVLGLQSALAIVVEFAGGLLFLALVLRRQPA